MYTIETKENKGIYIHHINLFVCHCILLKLYATKCASASPTGLTQCSEMVQVAIFLTSFPIGWTLSGWWLDPHYLHFWFCLNNGLSAFLVIFVSNGFYYQFRWFYSIKFCTFLEAILYDIWSPCASTLLSHANTCSLVTEFMSLSSVSTSIISTIIPSSFKEFIKLLFKCLSYSLCLQSADLI